MPKVAFYAFSDCDCQDGAFLMLKKSLLNGKA